MMGPVTKRVLDLRCSGAWRKPHRMILAADVADALNAENPHNPYGPLTRGGPWFLFGIPVSIDDLLPPGDVWIEPA